MQSSCLDHLDGSQVILEFKESVSLHSQQEVRFREYFEYFLMG